MIFTKDVLFLHVPKTGGSSLRHWLLDILPEPVYYAHPDHVDEDSSDSGIRRVHGRAHETLEEANEVLPRYGIDVRRLPLILAGLRNPYDLEVSRYFHLRTTLLERKGPGRKLAREADFETFVVTCKPEWVIGGNLEPYFLLDGEMPANLVIVKLENAHEELCSALAKIGIVTDLPLPWYNTSEHEHFAGYYTPAAEEAVYRRHQWVFDQGFYERLDRDRLKGPA
ncbi:MAG: hypothetical protein ABI896_01035 [Actinomycetota bacterium]